MDLVNLHRRTVESWATQVAAVRADQWGDPTPCEEWDVRDLVNHVVGEGRWTAPLLRGKTIADVGSQFDGDLLGDDPIGAARSAADEAIAAAAELVPAGGIVHLSYGDDDMAEYVNQLAADHLIHGWDLAKGISGDTTLDPELVAAVGVWFAEHEDSYRAAGAIGPRVQLTGDAQTDLLAAFGRRADWTPPR
ncbi:MAG: TIGR03086 family metal-binding protein [Nocardioidaceae bacterium]